MNSILKTSIITFTFLLSILYSGEHDKRYTPLFIGECLIDVPLTYIVTVKKDSVFLSNSRFFYPLRGDKNDYTLKWGKFNIAQIIREFGIQDIVDKRSIGNVTLYQMKTKSRYWSFIVGENFYIYSPQNFSKYMNHLLYSCVSSFGEKPYDETSIKVLEKDLQENFILLGNEPKYIVKSIFPNANILIDGNDIRDDQFLELKMQKYLKRYCTVKECIFYQVSPKKANKKETLGTKQPE